MKHDFKATNNGQFSVISGTIAEVVAKQGTDGKKPEDVEKLYINYDFYDATTKSVKTQKAEVYPPRNKTFIEEGLQYTEGTVTFVAKAVSNPEEIEMASGFIPRETFQAVPMLNKNGKTATLIVANGYVNDTNDVESRSIPKKAGGTFTKPASFEIAMKLTGDITAQVKDDTGYKEVDLEYTGDSELDKQSGLIPLKVKFHVEDFEGSKYSRIAEAKRKLAGFGEIDKDGKTVKATAVIISQAAAAPYLQKGEFNGNPWMSLDAGRVVAYDVQTKVMEASEIDKKIAADRAAKRSQSKTI